MAQITVNIPQYKIRSFLSFTRKLGIGKSIRTSDKKTSALVYEQKMKDVRRHISSFLLFDWEFFSNELEFE